MGPPHAVGDAPRGVAGAHGGVEAPVHAEARARVVAVPAPANAVADDAVEEPRRVGGAPGGEQDLGRDRLQATASGLVEALLAVAQGGVTPELADALGAIGQSPELVQTLNDPDVRVLMHDPNNLRMLAGMLQQAAAQAKAIRQTPPTDQAA